MSNDESEQVFEAAAELFSILSTPIRLRLISALCRGEKNVSQLLSLDRSLLDERVGRLARSQLALVDVGLRLVLGL